MDITRGDDRLHEVREMLTMLDEGLGIAVPLEDDALRLIVVEVGLVLQRAGVLGPHDLQADSGQPLELVDRALVKREPRLSL